LNECAINIEANPAFGKKQLYGMANRSQFIQKLQDIVKGNEGSAWHNDGNSFYIHDPRKFAKDVLPRHFRSGNYASFVRQLHLYGFRKIAYQNLTNHIHEESFQHPLFKRDHPELALVIVRRTNGVPINTAPVPVSVPVPARTKTGKRKAPHTETDGKRHKGFDDAFTLLLRSRADMVSETDELRKQNAKLKQQAKKKNVWIARTKELRGQNADLKQKHQRYKNDRVKMFGQFEKKRVEANQKISASENIAHNYLLANKRLKEAHRHICIRLTEANAVIHDHVAEQGALQKNLDDANATIQDNLSKQNVLQTQCRETNVLVSVLHTRLKNAKTTNNASLEKANAAVSVLQTRLNNVQTNLGEANAAVSLLRTKLSQVQTLSCRSNRKKTRSLRRRSRTLKAPAWSTENSLVALSIQHEPVDKGSEAEINNVSDN